MVLWLCVWAVLPQLPAIRGPVATGFGRGSRKLGFPTANLPASLFKPDIDQLPTGVYIGFAKVQNLCCKAVANVGFSPTFDEKNPEKIVEAHLLNHFDSDFYGEEMRLLLIDRIRPERKFESIDALVNQIADDVSKAHAALDEPDCQKFESAPWFGLTSSGDPELRMLDPEGPECNPVGSNAGKVDDSQKDLFVPILVAVSFGGYALIVLYDVFFGNGLCGITVQCGGASFW